MNRRIVGFTLVVVWIGTLAWLARRELWRTNASLVAEAAMNLPPGAMYYIISANGRQLGYTSTTVDTLADTLRVSELMVFEIPLAGDTQRSEVRTDVQLTRGLRLRDFSTTVRSDRERFTVTGAVDGDSLLTLRIAGSGTPDASHLRLARPMWLAPMVALNIALGGELVPGRTHTTRVLDPLALDPADATLTVAAESTLIVSDSAVFDTATGRFVPVAFDTVRVWALQVAGGGPPRTLWVDEHGLPVLETAPGGFKVERAVYEIAHENFRRLGEHALGRTPAQPGGPVVRRTALASGLQAPTRLARRLAVRVGGRPLDGLSLDGDGQRLSGDTLLVGRQRPVGLVADYRLPTGQREMAPFVRAAPLIQSGDPRIQAQARQVIGRTRSPEVAAERLVEWVFQNVRREPGAGGPSALDVLETRRGDCNEHTILFVAMARAVGLPARMVTGLVYRDGAFYYHAWPEVYLRGWVGVDPTFAQFPADAARIRLAVGSLVRQIELARLTSGLTLEVLSMDE
jgi:hypothetical protein